MDESRYKKKENGNCFFVYISCKEYKWWFTYRGRRPSAVCSARGSRCRVSCTTDPFGRRRERECTSAGRGSGTGPALYMCVCIKCVKSNEEEIIIYAQKLNFLSYRKSSTTIRDISPCLIIIIFLFDCVVHMCTYRVETPAMSKVSVIASHRPVLSPDAKKQQNKSG